MPPKKRKTAGGKWSSGYLASEQRSSAQKVYVFREHPILRRCNRKTAKQNLQELESAIVMYLTLDVFLR